MIDTFYYIAGRFCASGMGFNYCEKDVIVLEVRGIDYKDAEEEVKKFCYIYYGVQEQKDMWYGLVAYNWNYKQLYKAEFDRYKAKANDPKCLEFEYYKLKSAKLYSTPKVTVTTISHKNPDDYTVSETKEIKEFFS
jgi:hypothetical protein